MGTTYMVTGTISTSALVVVMFAFADGQSPPKTTTPSDADIRQILVDRIDLQHQSVGIVVGVIGPAGRRVMPMGIWRRRSEEHTSELQSQSNLVCRLLL